MNPPERARLDSTPCFACGDHPQRRETCKRCGGQGCEFLDGCPLKIVPLAVWDMLASVDEMSEHGLPPVGGGANDQTEAFMQARAFIRGEDARWTQEATKPKR